MLLRPISDHKTFLHHSLYARWATQVPRRVPTKTQPLLSRLAPLHRPCRVVRGGFTHSCKPTRTLTEITSATLRCNTKPCAVELGSSPRPIRPPPTQPWYFLGGTRVLIWSERTLSHQRPFDCFTPNRLVVHIAVPTTPDDPIYRLTPLLIRHRYRPPSNSLKLRTLNVALDMPRLETTEQ